MRLFRRDSRLAGPVVLVLLITEDFAWHVHCCVAVCVCLVTGRLPREACKGFVPNSVESAGRVRLVIFRTLPAFLWNWRQHRLTYCVRFFFRCFVHGQIQRLRGADGHFLACSTLCFCMTVLHKMQASTVSFAAILAQGLFDVAILTQGLPWRLCRTVLRLCFSVAFLCFV